MTMKIIPPYTPELLYEVQMAILHGEVYPRTRRAGIVLEYGSGWSTIWWARNGVAVRSIEADQSWVDEIRSVAFAEKLADRLEVYHHPWAVPTVIDEEYPVVFVDGVDAHRGFYIERAPINVKVGGAMVVDDSHWDLIRPSIERVLATGKFEREWTIGGMHVRKTGERKYHETTLLRRLK
jgi:predicted O-methyltransferase YrrM